MAMEIRCPGCGQNLQVSEAQVGQQVSCPHCQVVMQVPQAGPQPPQEELLEPEVADANADAGDRRPCPMCGEMIQAQALKCRFCGEIFDPELKKAQKNSGDTASNSEDDELSAAEWLFGILCSGIACIFGIVWAIQGKKKGGKMILLAVTVQIVIGVIRAMAEVGSRR